MSSKKRTKPAVEESQSHKKRHSNVSEPSPFAWTRDGVQVLLPSDKRLVFVGHGVLAVHSGEVEAGGRLLSASSGSVELRGDSSSCGAVAIEVVSTEARVPLAGRGGAAFSIAAGVAPPRGDAQRRSFEVYLSDDPAAPAVLDLPHAWRQVAGELAASISAGAAAGALPATVAVCGAKKVGKSAFVRYLANVLLNDHATVAYLDTDCGQPEFTPPGLLSLSLLSAPVLGPPHCHQRAPAAAHFFGDLSGQRDPGYYLRCIASLHRWHLARPEGLLPPLVVNTCGWIKGLGFDVLADTLCALGPTHFVHLACPNPKRNLPPGAFWCAPGLDNPPPVLMWQVPGLQNAAPQQAQRQLAGWAGPQQEAEEAAGSAARSAPSAVEQRGLQWTAFAQACVAAAARAAAPAGSSLERSRQPRGGAEGEGGAAEAASVGDQAAAAVPFEVDLADVAVQVLHSAVPPAELPRVLNGAVVGLCCSDGATAGGASAPPLPCLGVGIVRAVDAAAGRAFVLTDVPEERLQAVDVLQVGGMELPPALLQTGSLLSPYLALFSLATAGTGAGASKSRNNLQRAGQL